MRKEKELLLDEVSDRVQGGNSWLVMSYQGLNAAAAADFRRRLYDRGCDFEVVRKRLLVKATEKAGAALDLRELKGHIGVVIAGEDSIEATKIVYDFANETKTLQVLGGYIDGVLYASEDVEKLSKLPSKEVMQAQLLGLFEAPMSQTLAVVEAVLTSLPHLLENKAKEQG